jgi:hypothetical protein
MIPAPTARYGCKITTVDPTQGLIEAVLKSSLRNISVYSIPAAFEWPVVGDNWMVTQMNGSWYLEGRFPTTNSYQDINPGDMLLTAPTGVVQVTTDGDGFDYALMAPGRVILQAGAAPGGFLPCDGSSHSATTYPDLDAVLGDNSTTFNVPNLSPPGEGVGYYVKC